LASLLKVNKLDPQSGTDLELGTSGDTITITAGAVLGGVASALTSLNAASLGTGTVPDARFPATLPALDGSALTNLPTETKPTISSISPSTITNAQTAVTITGTNYVSIPTVNAISTAGAIYTPDTVAFTSATEIVATFTLATDTTYFIRVENNDGNAVRSTSALLLVSDDPVWTTSAGTLGNFVLGEAVSETVVASGDGVEYAVQSGTLPTGLSLASATGVISGTESSSITENTVYNFTIRATDDQTQYADRAFSMTIVLEYDVEFLIVAGGGGGASANGGGGGGGGAGGYRTSTQAVTAGVITIAVGTGGAAGVSSTPKTQGSDGGVSSISGSTITDMSSTGGGGAGGGGAPSGDPGGDGRDGGSGGGGGHPSGGGEQDGGSGNAGSYDPVEGYDGGDNLDNKSGGGGGGGAGEAGPDTSTVADTTSTVGGDGLENDIVETGVNVFYAGGGSGASYVFGAAGGAGGGGATPDDGGDASDGTDGFGGGGGGSYGALAGDGGNGVVILRMLTSDYTSTTTGSPTVTTDGDYTVLKFLAASGSYTA